MRTPLFIVVIVATELLASGCSHPQASELRAAQPVRTETVSVALPEPGVRYSASIEAFEQVALAFKASGYVDRLLQRRGADGRSRAVQPGDRVTAGTILAHVREADYLERIGQSRAKLAEAEAGLFKARLDLERARTLFASDSVTKPELDAAHGASDAADARVAAARADMELALIALRDCALVAPATGIILERRIEVGTLAAPNTVGFVLGNVSSVKARFGIPDAMIQSVGLGDAIEVVVEAVGATTFAGRVTAVAPTADPQSRVFDVEVTIPNAEGRLRPGMIGTVAISRTVAGAAAGLTPVAVPLTAIVRSDAGAGEFAVLVVQHENGVDIVRRRRVELGEVMGNVIAVTTGVARGEQVVVSGATLIGDGEPVRVLP